MRQRSKNNMRRIFIVWISSVLPVTGFSPTWGVVSSHRIQPQPQPQQSPNLPLLFSSVNLEEVTSLSSAYAYDDDDAKSNGNDDEDHDDDVLSAVFGSCQRRADFLTADLGHNVVRLHREELELASPLDKVKMKDLYDDFGDFTVLRKRGSREFLNKTAMPTYGHLRDYISTGGSAVVSLPPSLEGYTHNSSSSSTASTTSKFLLQFKASVEASLQRPTNINIYHSGPSASALNRHYDAYDVIVIQLDGEKEWEIQQPQQPQPHGDDDDDDDCMIWTNTTLKPGDVLYLPQGIYHAATTVAGFSSTTHATIGLTDS
jgi:hypothetical protein